MITLFNRAKVKVCFNCSLALSHAYLLCLLWSPRFAALHNLQAFRLSGQSPFQSLSPFILLIYERVSAQHGDYYFLCIDYFFLIGRMIMISWCRRLAALDMSQLYVLLILLCVKISCALECF